jgi:serine protease AprX
MRTPIRRFLLCFLLAALNARVASAQVLSSLLTRGTTPLSTTCPVSSLASSPKIDAALRQWAASGDTQPQQVIVSAANGALGSVTALVAGLGGTVLGTLPGINAAVARVDLPDLAALACALPVSSISLDAVVRAAAVDETIPAPATLRATLGLPRDTPAGTGVTVAVIDSGIARSADYANRIVAFFDGTRGFLATTPSDAYGHGTHVAGLIAGSGYLSGDGRYQGVGPQVRLVGMKVLDANGAGRTSDVIRAVELTTLLKPVLGVQVMNLSLGHPIFEPASSDPLVRAVEAASRAGIIVVAAAGNYGMNRQTGQVGYTGIASPGNAPSAITVGSVMTQDTTTIDDDRIAPYSSRGPSFYDAFAKPDIVAPGHRLVSDSAPGNTLYATYPVTRVSPDYLRLSGTSMAAAVASGAVALMLQAHQQAHPGAPALTPTLVKGILQYTSVRLHDEGGVEYDDLTQGAGSLNPNGAIELVRSIDVRQPLGSYWLTRALTPITRLQDAALVWSQRVLWRTQNLWGPTVDSSQAAWAFGTVWGDDNTWDSHIVWGTNAVWGNSSTWGSHIVWGTNDSTNDTHIVWGTNDSSTNDTHIVWGTNDSSTNDTHIVWGTNDSTTNDNHIVWGTTDVDATGCHPAECSGTSGPQR